MKNIGNNILDNLKQMRRPYVAPAVFMEEMEEEGEMLAGSPQEHEDPDTESSEEGDEEPAPKAKENDIFFSDEPFEW